jgi:hypothetical protein
VKSTALDISLENGVFGMCASGTSNSGESVRMWSQASWSAATIEERIPSSSVLDIKICEANVILGNPTGESWAACYLELRTTDNNNLRLCFGCDISSFYDPYSSCGFPCEFRDNVVHLHSPGVKVVDLSEYFEQGDYITDIIISTEIDENYSTSGSYSFFIDYLKFEQKQITENSL